MEQKNRITLVLTPDQAECLWAAWHLAQTAADGAIADFRDALDAFRAVPGDFRLHLTRTMARIGIAAHGPDRTGDQ